MLSTVSLPLADKNRHQQIKEFLLDSKMKTIHPGRSQAAGVFPFTSRKIWHNPVEEDWNSPLETDVCGAIIEGT